MVTNYLEWYKGLFAGVEPDNSLKAGVGGAASPSPAAGSLPSLPKKKDGSVSSF